MNESNSRNRSRPHTTEPSAPSVTTSRNSVSTDNRLPWGTNEFRSPDALSVQEILYWLEELSTNPVWGWSRNKANLARALGFRSAPKAAINSKLSGAWIWPTEQIRLSTRIRLIVNGHIVPLYDRFPHSYEYINPPRPPVKPPAKLRVSTHRDGPMLHVEQFRPPEKRMPDFKAVFKNARLWKTD